MLLVGGCTGLPENVRPVQDFELPRYLGKWYEIARLDHSFESGLSQVTAQYSMRDDGGVKVVNRGYSIDEKAWQEAVGKAYFVEGVNEGYLKVSFFGPFYGSYVIFELDKEGYEYAFVAGPDKSYLWFLSRTPQVDEGLKEQFIQQASRLGFDTDALIFPDHDPLLKERTR
ncbi:MAG: lipocalin family protein [Halioglobus sp.]|nr:lipocalin family protein [Halioglobus sp.]